MSSAKKDKNKLALCSHISKFDFALFYRAKPVSEMQRSGIERTADSPFGGHRK